MSTEKDIDLEIAPIKEPELAEIPINNERENDFVPVSANNEGENNEDIAPSPRRKKKKKKRFSAEEAAARGYSGGNKAQGDTDESDENNEGSFKRAQRLLLEISEMDEEDSRDFAKTLRSIIGGDVLAGWLRRNKWFIVLLIIYTLVYISNRYAIQQEMIESNHLADTLLDRRYKALTQSSLLLERSLRSNIEGNLRDTAIVTSTESPYVIKAKEFKEEPNEE